MYKKSMREALEQSRAYRDPVNEDRGFSSQQIKQAYGVLNDPRYKQGNYSGAVRAIEKIAKGLSNHPDVANALRRANEQVELGEGYENNMVTHLGELGIDVSFRLGKMIVHKSDLQRIKDALKDGIADRGSVIWNHRMPEFKFMGEEVKEALEVKWDANKQGWFDKQGKRRYLGKMATNKLMSKAIDKAKASGDWVKSFDLKHGQKPEQVEEAKLNEALNINIVKGMTQRNDHFGARLYIAEQMRDKHMIAIYQGLGLAHDNYNRYVGNSALTVRQKLETVLKGKIVGTYGSKKGEEIIKAL